MKTVFLGLICALFLAPFSLNCQSKKFGPSVAILVAKKISPHHFNTYGFAGSFYNNLSGGESPKFAQRFGIGYVVSSKFKDSIELQSKSYYSYHNVEKCTTTEGLVFLTYDLKYHFGAAPDIEKGSVYITWGIGLNFLNGKQTLENKDYSSFLYNQEEITSNKIEFKTFFPSLRFGLGFERKFGNIIVDIEPYAWSSLMDQDNLREEIRMTHNIGLGIHFRPMK